MIRRVRKIDLVERAKLAAVLKEQLTDEQRAEAAELISRMDGE